MFFYILSNYWLKKNCKLRRVFVHDLHYRKQFNTALIIVKREFAQKDPAFMAECAGAAWEEGSLKFKYCGCPAVVQYPSGRVSLEGALPSHEEEIFMLQYLTWAKGLPPRGRWLSFKDLRGGPHHWVPFQKEILFPLASAYKHDSDAFQRTILSLGGELTSQADAAGIIYILPKMPLYYLLWEASGEYPPRSAVLFDQVSETYLPTASLYVMAIEATRRIFLKRRDE